MRVVWTAEAIADLVQIREYIEKDQPAAASSIARRILGSAERLSQHPHLGRPGREPDTRELVVAGTPYIVPYRVRQGSVVIFAVLHGARKRVED